jgi:hypothetical protein
MHKDGLCPECDVWLKGGRVWMRWKLEASRLWGLRVVFRWMEGDR